MKTIKRLPLTYLAKKPLTSLLLLPQSSLKPPQGTLRLLTLTGLITSALAFSTASYAALSASTANTIEGSEPYFVLNGTPLTNTDELLGFLMPDGLGGKTQIKASDAGSNINIVAGTRFNDIELLIKADNTKYGLNTVAGLVVADNDGDASGGVGTGVGDMQAVFKEGTAIITNLNQTLSTCGGPYTLTVTTSSNVKATTPYGAPNVKSYNNSTVTYTLLPKGAGICYIQPKSMTIYGPTGASVAATSNCNSAVGTLNTTGDCKWGGGYNPAFWDYDASLPVAQRHKGFNVQHLKAAGKDFPTTGFKNASLTVIGSGTNQGLYKCDITGGTWVNQSTTTGGTNCTLTYNTSGRPTTNITVTLKTNDAASTTLDSYTIKAPVSGKWAEAGSLTGYTNNIIPYNNGPSPNYFSQRYLAAESCGGFANTLTGPANHAAAGTKFFKRAELTNTPIISAGYVEYISGTWTQVGSAPTWSGSGHFSRDADSTFMGEWGYLYTGYGAAGTTDSPWSANGNVWAAESISSHNQYVIYARGYVTEYIPTLSVAVAVCKR